MPSPKAQLSEAKPHLQRVDENASTLGHSLQTLERGESHPCNPGQLWFVENLSQKMFTLFCAQVEVRSLSQHQGQRKIGTKQKSFDSFAAF